MTTNSDQRLQDMHDDRIRILNDIDKGVIGVLKPKVQHIKQDFNLPSQFEGSDNMPNDPEQNWDEDN